MPKTTSTKPSRPSDDEVFRKLVNEVFKAWVSQDVSRAAPFYSKEAGLFFFDFAPLKYKGWNEYAKSVQKAFFDNMPPHSSRADITDEVQVRRLGNGAVTATALHFWAKMKDGSVIEKDGRHTAVWEKKGNRWLITHDHWSFPFTPS